MQELVRSRQEKPLERGHPGWLEVFFGQLLTVRCNFNYSQALAKDLENEKPKAGEFGWLVAMAKDMEEELRPSGDTTISNSSGELVSQRSSQGASSQGSRGNSDQIGGSSGEQSSTLRNVSGGQTSSQTFSQKLSQSDSEDNNLSQSSRKLSQSRSQKSSQPSSQPSSIKVLATQAVSSRLFALAAADSQVDEFTTGQLMVEQCGNKFYIVTERYTRCSGSGYFWCDYRTKQMCQASSFKEKRVGKQHFH